MVWVELTFSSDLARFCFTATKQRFTCWSLHCSASRSVTSLLLSCSAVQGDLETQAEGSQTEKGKCCLCLQGQTQQRLTHSRWSLIRVCVCVFVVGLCLSQCMSGIRHVALCSEGPWPFLRELLWQPASEGLEGEKDRNTDRADRECFQLQQTLILFFLSLIDEG